MYTWEKLKREIKGEESEFGDFTIKCFGKKPDEIVKNLPSWVKKYEIKGPYINIVIDWSKIGKKIIEEVISENFGKGRGKKKILIEYSSPNIAKPMHIGHLRNTIIGISLCRIHEFLGNKVRKVNWYGDTGTQFGKLILAYKLWGNEIELKKNPIKEMTRIYVKFHKEAKKDPSLEDKAREVYKKLEEGEEEFVRLWDEFTKMSLKEFEKIYKILGAEFDNYDGESKYVKKGKKMVGVLLKKKIAKKGEGGAIIVEFENLPSTLIQKKDGTTLYLTRDIATAIERKKEYGFDIMIYVVGGEQKLHFKQLFEILKKLRYKWADNCKHVSYGYVRLPEGKMSTREGRIILAEDVIKKIIKKAEKINKETAEIVGLGALNYSILKIEPKRDVVFDWDEVLRLKGNTAPYIQYSYVRAKHILEKTKERDFEWVEISEEEKKLLKKLAIFPEIVKKAGEECKPNLIANYVYGLAEMFNNFYEKFPVINEEDKKKRNIRIALVKGVKNVLEKGMFLLNIKTPEKM